MVGVEETLILDNETTDLSHLQEHRLTQYTLIKLI